MFDWLTETGYQRYTDGHWKYPQQEAVVHPTAERKIKRKIIKSKLNKRKTTQITTINDQAHNIRQKTFDQLFVLNTNTGVVILLLLSIQIGDRTFAFGILSLTAK